MMRAPCAALIILAAGVGGQSIVETVAGGFLPNGTQAASAIIGAPGAVAVDGSGNIYLAAAGKRVDNNYYGAVPDNIIYRIDSAGVISVVAGDGGSTSRGDGGPAVNASFSYLAGIAVDTAGTVLYAADGGARVVRRIDLKSGTITTAAGNGSSNGLGDGGPATKAALSPAPEGGLVVDAAGNLYIVETVDSNIRRVDAKTGIITTVASGFTAGFNVPTLITTDSSGNIYFVAGVNTVSTVFRIAGGTGPVTKVPVSIAIDIVGIAVDQSGRLYLSDAFACKIYRIAPGGAATVYAGTGTAGFSGDNGPAAAAMLNYPVSLAMDPAGVLYISDALNYRLRRIDAAGQIRTVAGTGAFRPPEGSLATQNRLTSLGGIAISGRNLYLCESNINLIRKMDLTTSQISTIAGSPYRHANNELRQGSLAGVAMPYCSAMGADPSGTLYFIDPNNRRAHKLTVPDSIFSTLPIPELRFPQGLAVDSQSNVFVSDGLLNQVPQRVWKVVLDIGAVTVAGGQGTGFSGDGGLATNASFFLPVGIAVDRDGSFYVADYGNNRIRKIDQGGVVRTIAGTGQSGYSGDFGPATAAKLNGPRGLALDNGFLFIADSGNHAIRRIDLTSGTIVTLAGIGTPGFRNGPASFSLFDTPLYLTADSGNLYVSDANNRVRRITQARANVNQPLSSVSAASFQTGPVAPDSIVAAFGSRLATATVVASAPIPPNVLGGASVKIRDSAGVERVAGLFFVSAGQANYLIPPATALGPSLVTLVSSDQTTFSGIVEVARVSPGIFALNGQGLAAANVLRVSGDGTQSVEDVYQLDTSQAVVSRAIDLGPATDRLFLLLYGTGFRNRQSDASAQATVGGQSTPVLFSGAQGTFPGLDQLNIELPRTLAGRGDVEIRITVDGVAANLVRVRVK